MGELKVLARLLRERGSFGCLRGATCEFGSYALLKGPHEVFPVARTDAAARKCFRKPRMCHLRMIRRQNIEPDHAQVRFESMTTGVISYRLPSLISGWP